MWYDIQLRKIKRKSVTYGPMSDRDVVREQRLNRLYNGTEANCLSELRMRKVVFHKLCNHLRNRGLLVDTLHVTVEEQVAIFVHIIGHKWTNRSTGFEFNRSGETVSRYFNLVLDALCILSSEVLSIRSTDTHPKITCSPGRFYPYFEGCIGALDGTHIPASVPIHMQDRFIGRKLYPTQNVLAAVDFDLRFVYVLAGWEGTAHDSCVLDNALSRPSGLKIPEGTRIKHSYIHYCSLLQLIDLCYHDLGHYFLADAGYAARTGILPPYHGVRYHLKEYQGTRQPEDVKELFNLRHSSIRTTVERAFGTLKNRCKIFSSHPYFPLKTQVKIVIACCTLHNLIIDEGPDQYDYDDLTWYANLPRSRRNRSEIQADNRAWAHKRDEMAQQMWNDKVAASTSQNMT